jgi:SAM-dependent methyltransferase
MNDPNPQKKFIESLEGSLKEENFVSLSLGNYKGSEENLKNIYVRKAIIKREEKLSFTYRYKTKDIIKNYDLDEGCGIIGKYMADGFRVVNLNTLRFNLHFEVQNNGKTVLKTTEPTAGATLSTDHNKLKKRPISPKNKPYLVDLNITDKEGNVFKNAQDKYRQINHYVDILSPLIKSLPQDKRLKVVDMGSGKGYLTFALYDYLKNVLDLQTDVTGVEFRADLVALCNKIAEHSDFTGLHFEEGTIEKYDGENIDMLIALHACDTATDDAIVKGITGNAGLIVVAPCCHKQVRREMEKHKVHNDVDFLTRYGIFLERQAEMVTDGIRAMILEYFGYKTKVFEFISDAHTPKNIMIVGQKQEKITTRDEKLLKKIKDTKAYFGIEFHHLEKMMGI